MPVYVVPSFMLYVVKHFPDHRLTFTHTQRHTDM